MYSRLREEVVAGELEVTSPAIYAYSIHPLPLSLRCHETSSQKCAALKKYPYSEEDHGDRFLVDSNHTQFTQENNVAQGAIL